MNKRMLMGIVAWSLLGSLGWCAVGERVGVVVAMRGAAGKTPGDGPPSRVAAPVSLLASLRDGEMLKVPKGSEVTYSVLRTGERYTVKGPCTWKVTSGPVGKLPATVSVLKAEQSRAAIAENSSINLSKYGGFTSRKVGVMNVADEAPEFFTDRPRFRFDYEASQPLTLYVKAPDAHQWAVVHATRVTDSELKRERWELPYDLKPGTRYELHRQPQGTSESVGEFFVTRWKDADLKPLRSLEKARKDLASSIELWEAYRRILLFDRAEQLLAEMQSTYANMAFTEQSALLDQGRPKLATP